MQLGCFCYERHGEKPQSRVCSPSVRSQSGGSGCLPGSIWRDALAAVEGGHRAEARGQGRVREAPVLSLGVGDRKGAGPALGVTGEMH